MAGSYCTSELTQYSPEALRSQGRSLYFFDARAAGPDEALPAFPHRQRMATGIAPVFKSRRGDELLHRLSDVPLGGRAVLGPRAVAHRSVLRGVLLPGVLQG